MSQFDPQLIGLEGCAVAKFWPIVWLVEVHVADVVTAKVRLRRGVEAESLLCPPEFSAGSPHVPGALMHGLRRTILIGRNKHLA